MRTQRRRIGLLIAVAGWLVGCGNPGTPAPTAVSNVAVAPSVAPTLTPTITDVPTATSTDTPTATATRTSTRTPEPSATFTSTPTAKPQNTATPRPTQVVPTATATATPVPAVFVPPPEVFQFDVGGFMKYLDFAHSKYQLFLISFGSVVHGNQIGDCRVFNRQRGEILGIVAFTDVPDQWRAMVDEYHALRERAIILIEPVNKVCQGGGGTVSDDIDRQVVDFYDMAQNRMHQMLKEIEAIINGSG